MAGDDYFAAVAALEGRFGVIETEAAGLLSGAMAGVAFGFEDGLDLGIVRSVKPTSD